MPRSGSEHQGGRGYTSPAHYLNTDRVELVDRGGIARGEKADLVVFDAAAVRDEATFTDPHRTSKGIEHVIVNGTAVVSGGAHTGARPGRALRKG